MKANLKNLSRTAVLFAAVTALAWSIGHSSAFATDPENPYWPCVQRKVPHISAGMMWGGPLVDESDRSWRKDGEVRDLVQTLSSRRVPIEEAQERIDGYANTLSDGKQTKLTVLFTGLLSHTNAERSDIIAGIEKFARRQIALAKRIKETAAEANKLQSKSDATVEELKRAQELDEQLLWDTRVFDEREQSLTYVCEVPVLLEQRLFALARQLATHLE
ncbi:hypothetical protein [Denitrobaculum tricleocarpae]|uniref:Secreted protein n=1 Tax=Denitrobaculum tricleocarpae TaxID=2591009 RepID=A0A545U0X2_9PROT|nr:hypothetical protein [Denitrobaculum tricleocarpae]TQV83115.1 hypothetical protein FKG95_00475 [Denitrobaculum tricleocarpae]